MTRGMLAGEPRRGGVGGRCSPLGEPPSPCVMGMHPVGSGLHGSTLLPE